MLEEIKKYLKKLGRTKFQAYLLVTIVNLILLVGHLTGHLQIDQQLDPYMPVLNLLVQALATAIYQIVEGSIDKEAQKQQVYVMPGASGQTAAAAQPDSNQAAIQPSDVTGMSWSEFKPIITFVNNELNAYMDHMDKGKLSDVAKEALARYKSIHDYLQSLDSLPPATTVQASQQGGGVADASAKQQ